MDELESRTLRSATLPHAPTPHVALPHTRTPGDTLSTADNLGLLAGQTQQQGSLSPSDNADFYRFNLSSRANLLTRLDGLSAGAAVQVMKIINGRGIVLRAAGASALSAGQISLRRLPPGNYAIKITGNQNTAYQLTLTPDYAGSTRPTAFNLGRIAATAKTVTDFVGTSDVSDVYRFVLGTTKTIGISLDALSDNADLILINSAGRTLAASHETGTTPETITATLHAGIYYLSVQHVTGDTNYNLSIT